MKILVAQPSGIVGQNLIAFLKKEGHEVIALEESSQASLTAENPTDTIFWDPFSNHVNLDQLEGFDAIVNLSGEVIPPGKWDEEKKHKVREIIVKPTACLSQAIASLKNPPKVLVSASDVGYYGSRGEAWVDEDTPKGSGYLADLCSAWESATDPVKSRGVRVVYLRAQMVLNVNLKKMFKRFKYGLGGVLGNGQQYMGWITLEDLTRIILYAIKTDSIEGPLNTVTPTPITNYEFTKTIGRIYKRPTFMRIPRFIARLMFGKIADEVVLISLRVVPKKLMQTNYAFVQTNLENALREVLLP